MIRRARTIPLATLLLAAASFPACGDDESSATGSGGASSSSSNSSSSSSNSGGAGGVGGVGGAGGAGGAGGCDVACDAVQGTVIDRWVGETATVDVPADLSAATVEALVPMGNGQWSTIGGEGNADGSFAIQDVPTGAYVLHFVGGALPSYVYTSAREIDLGTEFAGRVDAVAPAVAPTDLVTSVTKLEAWQGADTIEWLVANNNAWMTLQFAGPAATNGPADGDIALDALTLDWSAAFGAALIDNDKGDVLTLIQLSTRMGPGNVAYQVATRFVSFDDIVQTDGALVQRSGEFTDIVQDRSIALDLRPTEFVDIIPDANPSATDQGFASVIITLPGVGMYGAFGNSADLLSVDLGIGAADVDLGTVTYGNPYPAAWGASLFTINTFRVAYTAPGATAPANRIGSFVELSDAATAGAGPVQPKMSPVQDLQVNGMSAFSDLSGVTETPTVSWTAPAVGAPTYYFATVLELINNGGNTQAVPVANLYTKDTEVALPPGILAAGKSYYLRVRAAAAPIDIETQPLRKAGTQVWADALTNMITP